MPCQMTSVSRYGRCLRMRAGIVRRLCQAAFSSVFVFPMSRWGRRALDQSVDRIPFGLAAGGDGYKKSLQVVSCRDLLSVFRRAGPRLRPVCRADPVTAVPWAAVPVAAREWPAAWVRRRSRAVPSACRQQRWDRCDRHGRR